MIFSARGQFLEGSNHIVAEGPYGTTYESREIRNRDRAISFHQLTQTVERPAKAEKDVPPQPPKKRGRKDREKSPRR